MTFNAWQIPGYEERIVYVDSDTAKCSGEHNDHPLIYLKIPDEGYVVCGYCDIKFARKKEECE